MQEYQTLRKKYFGTSEYKKFSHDILDAKIKKD